MINGNATPQGTSLFVSRFSNNSALDFYSKSKQGLFYLLLESSKYKFIKNILKEINNLL